MEVIELHEPTTHIPPMKTLKGTKYRIWNVFPVAAALFGFAGMAPSPSRADQLTTTTVSAFAQYIRSKEARNNDELAHGKSFIWIDALPQKARTQAYADLKRGQIITRRSDECGDCTSIPRGLIHDWTGIVFIPGISIPQAFAALQDYDHDIDYYQPEVVKSKLLQRSGDDFRVYLRLKQVNVVTVVLDTEYDIRYENLDASHAYSSSYSTRIAEIENAGEPQEHALPVGDDHGFLWRLYSYWRFYQADGGVYLQCNPFP